MEGVKSLRLCVRTDKDIVEIYNQYVDMVYRVCFMYFKNTYDTEDAVQTTFIKLLEYKGEFRSQEHLKAWLLVTSSNICKNTVNHWWHKKVHFLDEEIPKIDYYNELVDSIQALPKKYKMVVYLYYYEGYKTKEIANLLKIKESTIRSRLLQARKLLRKNLGGNYE